MQSLESYLNNDNFLIGGKWSCHADDIERNFPACKIMFHWDDVEDGDLTWTDRVKGIVCNSGSTFTKDSSGARGTILSVDWKGDDWPILGNDDFAAIWTGNMTSLNKTAIFGSPDSNGGIGVKLGGSSYLTKTSSKYLAVSAVSPAPSLPFSGAIMTHADIVGDESRVYASSADGTENATALKGGGSTSLDVELTEPFDSETVSLATGADNGNYILSFWHFQSPKGTNGNLFKTAVKWMAANPGKIYPGLAGIL